MTNPLKFGYPAICREPDWLFSRHYIYIPLATKKRDIIYLFWQTHS